MLKLNFRQVKTYQVNFNDAENYMRFSIPDDPQYFMNVDIEYGGSGKGRLYPTLDKMLVGFHYFDFDSIGVPDEIITIRGLDKDFDYQVQTNQDGWAWAQLPQGNRYVFSTSILDEFQRVSASAREELEERIIKINFLSSGDYLDYLAEVEQYNEDLRNHADSIGRIISARAQNLGAVSIQGYSNRTRGLEPEERYELIAKKAQKDKEGIENDFTYFVQQGQEVNAVLHRYIDQWKDKVIVVDVTCSMDPYVDQVLSWIAMQLSQKEYCQFIFFNDGDGKAQHRKIIGSTGGFHYTGSIDIDTILSTLYYAESFGCSGDPPENDLEALLYSLAYMNNNSELILIADNTSSVRDIELLKNLDVPVRIILCGFYMVVHPDYLEIAYHTNGSIHTIEEDFMDIRNAVDREELIRISNIIYRYKYGRFVPATR